MKKHQKTKYIFIWSDYQSLLTLEWNLEAIINRREYEWNRINSMLIFSQENNLKCYHGSEDMLNDEKRGRKFLDIKYGEKFLELVEKRHNECWVSFRKFKRTDYKKASNQMLLDLLDEAKNLWIGQISLFRALQAEGTQVLIEETSKHFSKKEMDILVCKTEMDIADKEVKEWKKIASKNNVSDASLLEHAYKFPWIVSAHFRIEDVLDTLRNRLKNGMMEENSSDGKEKKALAKKQKKILSKASLKVRNYVDLIHKLSVARMKIKSCWAGLDLYIIPLFDEIASRTGETAVSINKNYTTEEIKRLLIESKKISPEEKRRRNFCYLWFWENKQLTKKSGEKALVLADKKLNGELLSRKVATELKGMPANPGRHQGIARILMANNMENANRLRKEFKKGEILISQMTQPNIMDIASRAGAIVTDEGGMLSHAAIISREFGVPCIVGTHKATTAIKDGDLVEVDADKGLVKIVRKK